MAGVNLLARVVHPPNVEAFTSREVHPREKHIAVDDSGFLQISPETSGWDVNEGVFKVATYVWDTDVLQWVRATSAGGSSGGSIGASPKRKVIDQASSSVIYIGEAAPGTPTSSASWRIKRVETIGQIIDIRFAGSGASTQIWDNRAGLTYS